MNELPNELATRLTAEHDAVNRRHAEARERTIRLLPEHEPIVATWGWPAWIINGAFAAAAGLAAIVFAGALTSPREMSAMDRVSHALGRVASFAWRMEVEYVSRAGEGRTVRDENRGRWRREPLGLHASIRVVETKGANKPEPSEPIVLVDIEETHRRDLGVLIDHRRKSYWWIHDGYDGSTTPGGSPQVLIFKVRERRGRVLRELGEKEIDGRPAEGFVIRLDDRDPESDLGPAEPDSEEGRDAGWDWRNVEVETWVDRATDLPIEFFCKRVGDDFETTYRVTGLEWNVDFPPDAFEPSAPGAGYTETAGGVGEKE